MKTVNSIILGSIMKVSFKTKRLLSIRLKAFSYPS